MFALLRSACPSHLKVLAAPLDVVLSEATAVQPDLLVAAVSDFTDRNLPGPPLLAVEILSPSTRLIDLNLKKATYERAGVPSYWVVDPQEPRVVAWDLVGGRYRRIAEVTGDEVWETRSPFVVSITPADLVT